jgi:hypothetical protein
MRLYIFWKTYIQISSRDGARKSEVFAKLGTYGVTLVKPYEGEVIGEP